MEEKIYDFIKTYFKQHGYVPSIREIQYGVGSNSSATIHRHVQKLIEEGKLATDHPKCSRAYRIV